MVEGISIFQTVEKWKFPRINYLC